MRLVPDKLVEFLEAALIEKQIDPLARAELSFLVLARIALGAAACFGFEVALAKFFEAVGMVAVGGHEQATGRERVRGGLRSSPGHDPAAGSMSELDLRSPEMHRSCCSPPVMIIALPLKLVENSTDHPSNDGGGVSTGSCRSYFFEAGAVALVIAWATVFIHARRVANANPIHALRYE